MEPRRRVPPSRVSAASPLNLRLFDRPALAAGRVSSILEWCRLALQRKGGWRAAPVGPIGGRTPVVVKRNAVAFAFPGRGVGFHHGLPGGWCEMMWIRCGFLTPRFRPRKSEGEDRLPSRERAGETRWATILCTHLVQRQWERPDIRCPMSWLRHLVLASLAGSIDTELTMCGVEFGSIVPFLKAMARSGCILFCTLPPAHLPQQGTVGGEHGDQRYGTRNGTAAVERWLEQD